MDAIAELLNKLASDGNLDLEDIDHAVDMALNDSKLSLEELEAFRAGLLLWSPILEPSARTYLSRTAEGTPPRAPNRVVLAPHPRNRQADLYYARTEVVALQEALTELGLPTTVDGDYGPGTARSVQKFQERAGLPATGAVDTDTLREINAALAEVDTAPLDLSPRNRIRPDTVVTLEHSNDTARNEALQAGLNALADHFGNEALKTRRDGVFDEATAEAVEAFQDIAMLPQTGIVDTSTVEALDETLERLGLPPTGLEPPAGEAGHHGTVELHFFPGRHELKLYVERDGEVLDTYAMVGGHPDPSRDSNNPDVTYTPTPEGSYEVVDVSPHQSWSWAYSYVPYGAHLRQVDGEVQYRDGRGTWRWATGPSSVFADRDPEPLDSDDYLDDDGELLPVWPHSDFGHLRGRLRNLRTGALVTHMIHSSPDQEETSTYFADTEAYLEGSVAIAELRYSHGCEHIHPRDLDEMVSKGYLAPGTPMVVHGYDETHPSKA